VITWTAVLVGLVAPSSAQVQPRHDSISVAFAVDGKPARCAFVSQPDPPAEMEDSMKKEQPNASGERARNIAYALAVYGFEYERNRDYLLRRLSNCLARPRESPENDECDGELLDFVTNLYWRGDDSLLAFLASGGGYSTRYHWRNRHFLL
jgi:hypothetical protein